ncbi:hypothetical protein HLB44_36480 [Aquincola sp. S2]|uniref:Uncharacterized protein n=1 Tax=Pseudaquabacterium terrae TaxID=2732868 RepID=A0ABX2EVI8_9BURK|nr:hypothetical protein [Aquabacterium terrae]NRF72461.1 hypothetical protein [Aquabacterium terrae]
MIEAIVNTETLKRSARGSITGELFLRSAGEDFPDRHWSDFPVVVLAWWINGLRKVVVGREDSYVGDFMDGPYAFVVKRTEGDVGQIAWCRDDEEIHGGNIDVYAFQQSVVSAAQSIAAACHANGWSSADLENLEQAIAQNAA